MTEEWRSMVGFPGYEVSDLGNVRCWLPVNRVAAPPNEGRPLKAIADDGYRFVAPRLDGKNRKRPIHALVLEAFVGPRPEGMQACHGNGDRTDNRLSNLRWGTAKENGHDKVLHGTQVKGSRFWSAKLDELEVAAMRMGKEAGLTYAQLGSLFFVSPTSARRACIGQTWKHIGGL